MLDYTSYFVPNGRELIIKSGGKNIFDAFSNAKDIHLLLTEGASLKVSSKYTNLIDIKTSPLLNLLSSTFKVGDTSLPSGQFALQGLQIWESTDPISFSLDVKLNMVNSGKDDVLKPALHLMKATLPSKNSESSLFGQCLIPPGPNIGKILELSGLDAQGLQQAISAVMGGVGIPLEMKDPSGTFIVEVGSFLKIENVIITDIEPKFSEELDEDYCPISCDLSIGFQTAEVATVQMLENMISSVP
jgi:hypothetical protein